MDLLDSRTYPRLRTGTFSNRPRRTSQSPRTCSRDFAQLPRTSMYESLFHHPNPINPLQTYDDYHKLSLVQGVINETLRLFPAVGRVASTTVLILDHTPIQTIQIPKICTQDTILTVPSVKSATSDTSHAPSPFFVAHDRQSSGSLPRSRTVFIPAGSEIVLNTAAIHYNRESC
jgi:hypothetical protein